MNEGKIYACGTTLNAKYAVGDDVWIPQKLEGRIRAFKTKIYAVQITDFGTTKQIVYYDNTGKPIEAPVTGTIEKCEAVLNLMDKQRREFNESLAKIIGEDHE